MLLLYPCQTNCLHQFFLSNNMDDLITQVRLKNIASLSEIKYLILENEKKKS